MSYTTVLLPIIAALSMANKEFLNVKQPWIVSNKQQKTLVDHYLVPEPNLTLLSPHELSSIASMDVNKLNAFLQDHGFTIKLDPFSPPDFGVVSILDIVLEWAHKGKASTIMVDTTSYQAVHMKKAEDADKRFGLFVTKEHQEPIIQIPAKNGDMVFMTIAEQPIKGFALINKIHELSTRRRVYVHDNYDAIKFPMIDLDQKMELTWLKGLKKPDRSGTMAVVTQALQQTRFQMNEEGAAAQSAVAIAFTRTALRESMYTIDKPFYLWIMRPGLSIPLFAAYLDPADWKKPARLGSH